MKKLLLLSLLAIPSWVVSMALIPSEHVSSKEQALKIYSNNHDIFVEDDNAAYRVQSHNMNPLLMELTKRKCLEKFVGKGYLRINKIDEGKFEALAKVRGLGGGPGGATVGFHVGKWATYFVAYGAIGIASMVTGPASGPTATATGLVAAPYIEAASNVVALGCGLIGGILTGPA